MTVRQWRNATYQIMANIWLLGFRGPRTPWLRACCAMNLEQSALLLHSHCHPSASVHFSSNRFLILCYDLCVFTALHVMQTRSSDENSVCLSVCPSVTRVIPDKMEERSVQIFIPYERTFSLVFWEEEWLVAGDPFYVKLWVNRPPLERNRRFSTNNRS